MPRFPCVSFRWRAAKVRRDQRDHRATCSSRGSYRKELGAASDWRSRWRLSIIQKSLLRSCRVLVLIFSLKSDFLDFIFSPILLSRICLGQDVAKTGRENEIEIVLTNDKIDDGSPRSFYSNEYRILFAKLMNERKT